MVVARETLLPSGRSKMARWRKRLYGLVARNAPSATTYFEIPPNRVIEDQSARDTRQRLREVLDQYPPSVGQVLRLDPSLMMRPDYLAPYPALANFHFAGYSYNHLRTSLPLRRPPRASLIEDCRPPSRATLLEPRLVAGRRALWRAPAASCARPSLRKS